MVEVSGRLTRFRVEVRDRVRSRLLIPWQNRIWLDLVVALIVAGGHLLVVRLTGHGDVLGWATSSERRPGYAASALVLGLLGTISSVAATQLGSSRGNRVRALLREWGDDVARTLRSVLRGAGFAALVALVAVFVDVQASPGGQAVARWAYEFAILLAILKFCRLTSILSSLLLGNIREDQDEQLAPPVEIDPRWLTPTDRN